MSRMGEAKYPVSFAARWKPDDLAEIKSRAASRGMSASEYVRQCALGLLDVEVYEVPPDERFAQLEERMDRLEREFERAANLGAF